MAREVHIGLSRCTACASQLRLTSVPLAVPHTRGACAGAPGDAPDSESAWQVRSGPTANLNPTTVTAAVAFAVRAAAGSR